MEHDKSAGEDRLPGTDPDHRWRQGEAAIQGMIDRGELQLVEPSRDHAERLMVDAGRALDSAERNTADDPRTAYVNAYDAARLSIAAVLAKQGLRATVSGGHLAVQEAIENQLGPNTQHLVRGFARLRRHRNDAEYADIDTPEFTGQEAREACEDAQEVVTAMHRFLPLVGPFD
jgi:HEPN domain-containing protein